MNLEGKLQLANQTKYVIAFFVAVLGGVTDGLSTLDLAIRGTLHERDWMAVLFFTGRDSVWSLYALGIFEGTLLFVLFVLTRAVVAKVEERAHLLTDLIILDALRYVSLFVICLGFLNALGNIGALSHV